MAKSARKYRELKKQLKWQEIQEKLKDNEVAIEFFNITGKIQLRQQIMLLCY